MHKRTIALATAGSLLAVPAALALTAAPAHADVERRGTCGSGTYELSVDREGRGYEVSLDLDSVAPGNKWRIVIRQDGTRRASVVRTVERDGDLDVERYLPNTAGTDTFAFTAKRIGSKSRCGGSLTV